MYWISKYKFVECVFHIVLQSFSSDRITHYLNVAFIIFSETNKNEKNINGYHNCHVTLSQIHYPNQNYFLTIIAVVARILVVKTRGYIYIFDKHYNYYVLQYLFIDQVIGIFFFYS